jgi:hypothetical protein
MLLELVAIAELFHTAGGTAYADLPNDGRRKLGVRSPRFRAWSRRLLRSRSRCPSAAALQFDGPERTIHVRVAEQPASVSRSR